MNMAAISEQQRANKLSRLTKSWTRTSLLYFASLFLATWYLNSTWAPVLLLYGGEGDPATFPDNLSNPSGP